MRAKIYIFCALVTFLILIIVPATLAHLTIITTPPEDAGALNVGEMFTLTFEVSYSGSTDSRAAISVGFNPSGWTYTGFTATMNMTDVSAGFTETVSANKVDLVNNALAPDEGNLSVTADFAATTEGSYTFNWSTAFSIMSGTNSDVKIAMGSTDATITFGVEVVDARILNAPANTVYFIFQDPKCMWRPQSAFDVLSGGIVYGLCTNPQNQGFNTTQHWLLPTGAINTTTIHDAAIAMFGGSAVHVAVKYYIENAALTPVKEALNGTHVWFASRSDEVLAAMNKSDIGKGHEDFFVIETFTEGNNLFLVMYGMDWLGTWASGIYFKEVVYPTLASYTDDYYIFHWTDDPEQDGIPQNSEIHLETSG